MNTTALDAMFHMLQHTDFGGKALLVAFSATVSTPQGATRALAFTVPVLEEDDTEFLQERATYTALSECTNEEMLHEVEFVQLEVHPRHEA